MLRDILDCQDFGIWSRCRCGSSRFEVVAGGDIAPVWLTCVECKRSGAMKPEHFSVHGWPKPADHANRHVVEVPALRRPPLDRFQTEP
jgi:hypothetical protein